MGAETGMREGEEEREGGERMRRRDTERGRGRRAEREGRGRTAFLMKKRGKEWMEIGRKQDKRGREKKVEQERKDCGG